VRHAGRVGQSGGAIVAATAQVPSRRVRIARRLPGDRQLGCRARFAIGLGFMRHTIADRPHCARQVRFSACAEHLTAMLIGRPS